MTFPPKFWTPSNASGVAATMIYEAANGNLITVNFYWPQAPGSAPVPMDQNALMASINNFIVQFTPTQEDTQGPVLHFSNTGGTFTRVEDPRWEEDDGSGGPDGSEEPAPQAEQPPNGELQVH